MLAKRRAGLQPLGHQAELGASATIFGTPSRWGGHYIHPHAGIQAPNCSPCTHQLQQRPMSCTTGPRHAIPLQPGRPCTLLAAQRHSRRAWPHHPSHRPPLNIIAAASAATAQPADNAPLFGNIIPLGPAPTTPQPPQPQPQHQRQPHKDRQHQDINNLPPLPCPAVGFQLPPAAPMTWGFMITYLVFMLIVPIVALLVKASQTPADVFMARAFEPVAVHAYYVSFSCALAAAAINSVFGFLLAWVLVKYDFPCKKWIDAAVDLPFALPTSVAGLTLATVYSDETFLGQLLESLGMPVVFTRLGVALAMVFVSFPFVVRTMQPVIQEMQVELEEAAWTLGASPWKTFTDVLMPPLLPPLLTGTALAFSRALGEFGSIVILSSNFAFKDLIAPVLIFQCLEQYDFTGATIIGTVLLGISLAIMLLVNWIQTLGGKFKNN